ncbi:hypothetical protein TEA_007619 [Camellia sinensis var. sinensis]|uniref:SBNO alpha/beta domain-containing protein n=1 Tax=Camellia sinensis var. sinensis TaxID=542762 RepID=A0A4S4DJ63_CAMSN|nr:hypothetical protein TEA_007619 [Camellia sinensis var. sinensis]
MRDQHSKQFHDHCFRDVDPLESLQDLPNLVELQLLETYEGAELCFKAGRFRRLVILDLRGLKGLRWVKVEAGSMPHLEELIMVECELVEELPSGIEHLTNLKYLELNDMSDGLISSLNRDLERGNYWKIAHIPKVWVGDSYYAGNYLCSAFGMYKIFRLAVGEAVREMPLAKLKNKYRKISSLEKAHSGWEDEYEGSSK